MQTLYYNIILRPEPEGGFTVTAPALPGCVTYGKNLQEAKKMAKDAIRLYVASLRRHREPIPTDDGSFISAIELTEKNSNKKMLVYA